MFDASNSYAGICSDEKAEDERKRPERLRRWNELRAQLGYERTNALLNGVKPESEEEQEFAALIPLSKARKIWQPALVGGLRPGTTCLASFMLGAICVLLVL